jgi:hypothetical protein
MPFFVVILRWIDLKHRQDPCLPFSWQPTSRLRNISCEKASSGWRDPWLGIGQATKRIHAEMKKNDESKSKEQM